MNVGGFFERLRRFIGRDAACFFGRFGFFI